MATISRFYTSGDVKTGATIIPGHINTDLDTIYGEFNGNISNTNIASGAAIAYSKLNLANSITDSDLVNGIRPRLVKRQGGSSTIWNTTGTSNYTPTTPKIQCGMATSSASTSTSGSFTYSITAVTFPEAFTYPPLVFATVEEGTGWTKCTDIDATQVNVTLWGITSSTPDLASKKFQWIAIGI